MDSKKKIIFVYNADTGLFNSINDFMHKIFPPETYKCNLCSITYGSLLMKKEWKKFVVSLDYEIEFLHKDEFYNKYPNFKNMNLPAVFSKTGNKLNEVISAEEINKCKNLDALKKLVSKKFKEDFS